MSCTWRDARRVLIALLALSVAGLVSACEGLTAPERTPSIELSDEVVVEDDWARDVTNEAEPKPVRKRLER